MLLGALRPGGATMRVVATWALAISMVLGFGVALIGW